MQSTHVNYYTTGQHCRRLLAPALAGVDARSVRCDCRHAIASALRLCAGRCGSPRGQSARRAAVESANDAITPAGRAGSAARGRHRKSAGERRRRVQPHERFHDDAQDRRHAGNPGRRQASTPNRAGAGRCRARTGVAGQRATVGSRVGSPRLDRAGNGRTTPGTAQDIDPACTGRSRRGNGSTECRTRLGRGRNCRQGRAGNACRSDQSGRARGR